ncbi:hypothetical protein ABLE91_23585 [Aquabacter sp. CN5-332]
MSKSKDESKIDNNYKSMINRDFFRLDNKAQLKKINNIFIETELSIKGLKMVLEDVERAKRDNKDRFHISAPTAKGKIGNISRSVNDVLRIINERIGNKEYLQSLVFSISLTEDYISRTLIRIIKAYPEKILVSTKGNAVADSGSLSVDMRDILKAGNLDEIIAGKINHRVRDALYASPANYFTYLNSILGFSLPEDVWKSFVEIKATRDTYIHGDGCANDTYIFKCRDLSRAKLGEKLIVDGKYLAESITCMKRIFTEIYSGLQMNYGNSEEVHNIFLLEGGD